MSTAVSPEVRITSVDVSDEMITANLADGRIISVPLAWSWRLAEATPAQRARYEILADGHGSGSAGYTPLTPMRDRSTLTRSVVIDD